MLFFYYISLHIFNLFKIKKDSQYKIFFIKMGISFSSQQSSITQSVNNNILNASTATCGANCTTYSGGNTVIISGTTIQGNVTFNQSCTTNMSCTINSQLNTNVTDILNSMQKQTSITANGFPSFSIDGVSNIDQARQNITTSVANIINSSCQSTTDIVSQNNFTYLNNDQIGGSLTFAQTGTANNNCTLNNISSIVVANNEQATSTQTAAILNPISLLVVAIIAIGLLIGAIFFLNFLFKSGKKQGGTQKLQIEGAPGVAGEGAAGEAGLAAEAAEIAPLAAI